MDLLKQSNNSGGRPDRRGITLVELLVASGIALTILVAVGLVYFTSNKSFKFGQATLSSQADLRLAMDWLCRDIRKAEGITKVVSGDTVTVTLNMPSSVASYDVVYVLDDEKNLKRNDGTSVRTVATDIATFEVTTTDDTVALTLSSVKTVLGDQYQRSLTSRVTMRNAK